MGKARTLADAVNALQTKSVTLTGTGGRIYGDFSNSDASLRTLFQTSVQDAVTTVGVIPNGTATAARFTVFGDSNPTNASALNISQIGNTESRITATRQGTGAYCPLTFYVNNAEVARFDLSGDVSFPGSLTVAGAAISPPGMILLAELTPTVANAVDALSVFSSTYDDYRILVEGVRPDTGTPNLFMQFAVGGAVVSASNCLSASTGGTGSSASSSVVVSAAPIGAAALTNCSVVIDILGVNDTANPKAFHVSSVSCTSGTSVAMKNYGGSYVGATAISGVRFLWNAGSNFVASGKIRIYGIKKS